MSTNYPFAESMRPGATRAAHASGFSLVEMMIALVIGLIVSGGVTSIFLANQNTYRANEALSDVQEGSRVAFELLARDLRMAGLSGCNTTSGRVANVLNDAGTDWFADWNNALHGYDNNPSVTDPALTGLPTTGATSPVAGKSSVHVLSTGAINAVTLDNPGGDPAELKISQSTTDLATGDVVIICDYDHSTIVQISNYAGNQVVVHNSGHSESPGNCTKDLNYYAGMPNNANCSSNGPIPQFPANSQIAKLTGHVWYIGNNSVGGTSLYLLNAVNSGGNIAVTPQEMVRNVTDLTITYNQSGNPSFGNAASITNWGVVDSAQISLSLQSTNTKAGNNYKPIVRTYASTTTVRNRVQ